MSDCMRSSPLLMLALVGGGLALIAVPLVRLTGAEGAWRGGMVGRGAGEVQGGDGEASGLPVLVRLRFAHEPLRVLVTQDGREVILVEAPGRAAGGEVEKRGVLMGPTGEPGEVEKRGVLMGPTGEPVELVVEASWPEGTGLTALGVELEPDGLENRRETVWAEGGSASELLTFSWK
jgi:hypothetical protein